MNPISKAISEIRYTIPEELLLAGFVNINRDFQFNRSVSLDAQIRSVLMQPRVLVDLSLHGGTQIDVDLTACPRKLVSNNETVIYVPKSQTGGRTIISVLALIYYNSAQYANMGYGPSWTNAQMFNSQDTSAVVAGDMGMMSALDNVPIVENTECEIIGENTVRVREGASLPSTSRLRVILAYDESLSNLQVRSIPDFCQLVKLAAKSYLYNRLIVRVDQAQLMGGMEIGRFMTVLESYSDAEENYQTFLKDKWRAIALMNDRKQYRRYLKGTIGGFR